MQNIWAGAEPYDMWLAKLMNRLSQPTLECMHKHISTMWQSNNLKNDDYRLLVDSAAYYCLVNGMNWGTAYESYPITEVYGFTEPAEEETT
jgi:hypothetical protein